MRHRSFIASFFRKGSHWCIAAIFLILVDTARAQYQLHAWSNFEDGQIGSDTIKFGGDPDKRIRVVDLSTVTGMPPEFYSTAASSETGRYALELTANPDPAVQGSQTVGVAVGTVVDRRKLGREGRALYQADFFIPASGDIPSLAVLAMEPPYDEGQPPPATMTSPAKFYRFGITLGKVCYFSYVSPEKQNATTYRHDPQMLGLIPKPGWHRFCVVVTGGKDIYCYIDGRGMNFSPLDEEHLQRMLVGVMLADNKRSYRCYVDNISIQMSTEMNSMPDSPYGGWTISAGEAVRRSGTPEGSEAIHDLRWLDPAAAWQKAQEKQIPMVMFFYMPRQGESERIKTLFGETVADQFVEKHACTRIDVNQLQGGAIAKKYGVFKVPTVLSISPDAKSYKTVMPRKTDKWSDIAPQLEP